MTSVDRYLSSDFRSLKKTNLEPSLCPTSDLYRMDEPQTLPWKNYEFRVQPNGSSLMFKCAEMSSFTIGQASKQDPRVRFAQGLHTLKFAIKIRVTSMTENFIEIHFVF